MQNTTFQQNGYRLLGAGVDTLVFWVSWGTRYSLPRDFTDVLDEGLEVWRGGGDFPFLGVDTFLPITNPDTSRPYEMAEVRGRRHFRWLLLFAGGKVSVALADPSKQGVLQDDQPQAYVELSGSYMRRRGRDFQRVVTEIVAALSRLVGAEPVAVRISRVDLFADLLLSCGLSLEHLPLFTCRGRARRIYLREEAPEGAAPPPCRGPPSFPGGTPRGSPPRAPPPRVTRGAQWPLRMIWR